MRKHELYPYNPIKRVCATRESAGVVEMNTIAYRTKLLLCFLALLCLFGCQVPLDNSKLGKSGCKRCHPVRLDKAHDLACVYCHRGNPDGRFRKVAHQGLISHPACYEEMKRTCGSCHPGEVTRMTNSLHFTLGKEIASVWRAFFPGDKPPSFQDLPIKYHPETARDLIADMLRRRCLRCHVYYSGDDYQGTMRGTGCAACHFVKGLFYPPLDHRFNRKVPDDRCLSCHYANFVGWDFYGRFEADYPEDFRAPLYKGENLPRPYGVEWHAMVPDIHQRAGMGCSDCHNPMEVKPMEDQETGGDTTGIKGCLSCHLSPGKGLAKIMNEDTIGHRPTDRKIVACATCHALWSFQDYGRALMRQDIPDYDDWFQLAVQGSSEVETQIELNLQRPVMDWVIPWMSDKFTGEDRYGLWLEGFSMRRWVPVMLGKCSGKLYVIRPILDISVSYVDFNGDVLFDNLRPAVGGGCEPLFVPESLGIPIGRKPGREAWRPYTPHTIGKADAFRTLQVTKWLTGISSAQ